MSEIVLPVEPSLGLQAVFVAMAVGMTILFAIWTGHRAIAFGWLLVTGALTATGLLQSFELPPRFVLLFMVGLVALTTLAWRSDWNPQAR